MIKLSQYRVLVSGMLSPVAALFLYALVYSILKRASSNLEADWLPRLFLSTLAMTIPSLVTAALAVSDRRKGAFSLSGKIGLVLATLSLGLTWSPMSEGILRSKQAKHGDTRRGRTTL